MKQVNEMRAMINEIKDMLYEPTLTVESFILPEDLEQDEYPEEESFQETEFSEQMPSQQGEENVPMQQENNYSDIQKEIIQIRKIALSVITRLADNPSSESYDLMKKIWNMIDKVNDNKNELQKK